MHINIMNNYKKYILEIIIAILILWFQSPLNIVKEQIINLFINLNEYFSENYYILLSTRNKNLTSNYTLTLINQCLIFILVLFFFKIKEEKQEVKNILGELNNTKKGIEDYDKNELENKINSFKEKLLVINKKFKKITKVVNTILLIIAIYLFYIIFWSLILNQASEQISEFEHDLKIIEYKLNEKEIKKLEFKWATMKNKSDYLKIKKEISKIKK